MRSKLALATVTALAVVGGTGATAYAVATQGWVNPTRTGNVLPIDDNHSPIPPAATTTDDHGRRAEPGEDRRGGTTTPATRTATPTDDHGPAPEPGDDRAGVAAAHR